MVKTTMFEYANEMPNSHYTYEVGDLDVTPINDKFPSQNRPENLFEVRSHQDKLVTYPVAKLLEKVTKEYDDNTKVLDALKKDDTSHFAFADKNENEGSKKDYLAGEKNDITPAFKNNRGSVIKRGARLNDIL